MEEGGVGLYKCKARGYKVRKVREGGVRGEGDTRKGRYEQRDTRGGTRRVGTRREHTRRGRYEERRYEDREVRLEPSTRRGGYERDTRRG